MARPSRIYVGGLHPDITEGEIDKEFGRIGKIRSIWIARKPPGFAFVEYEDERDADDACKELDGRNGWRVEPSRRPPGGGGGGGGGRGPPPDRYGGGGGGPRGASELRCYECGEVGHLANWCRMNNGGGRPRRDYSPGDRDRGRDRYRSPDRRRGSPPPRRDSPGRGRDSPVRGGRDSPVRGRGSPDRVRDRSRERRRSPSPKRSRSYSR